MFECVLVLVYVSGLYVVECTSNGNALGELKDLP